jgi:carotenoid phi-ring synthase / carotenoid chi-ring synthase
MVCYDMINSRRTRATPWSMRAHALVTPNRSLPHMVPPGANAIVVGGGVAGVAAAVVLADRGARVFLLDAAE